MMWAPPRAYMLAEFCDMAFASLALRAVCALRSDSYISPAEDSRWAAKYAGSHDIVLPVHHERSLRQHQNSSE